MRYFCTRPVSKAMKYESILQKHVIYFNILLKFTFTFDQMIIHPSVQTSKDSKSLLTPHKRVSTARLDDLLCHLDGDLSFCLGLLCRC